MENHHGNGDEKNVVSVAVCGDGDGEFFSLRGRGWGGIPWRGILHCQHMAVQFYLTLGDRDSKLPVFIDDDECVGDGRPHIEKFYYLFLRTSWIFPHAEDAAACRGPYGVIVALYLLGTVVLNTSDKDEIYCSYKLKSQLMLMAEVRNFKATTLNQFNFRGRLSISLEAVWCGSKGKICLVMMKLSYQLLNMLFPYMVIVLPFS